MNSEAPDDLQVDFSGYALDMPAKAFSRLLSRRRNGPVVQAFLEAFIKSGPQWTYDEIIKQLEANTIFAAKGENQDIIGRIVGAPRKSYAYDDSQWFFSDSENQGCDSAPCWVKGAPFSSYEPADDETYRMRILARIACNFNKFSSVPELIHLIRFVTGYEVSFIVVGPMEAQIVVPSSAPNTIVNLLTQATTTTECDDIYAVPYSATLNLSRALYVPDGKWFCSDREDGFQCDAAPCAVAVPLNT
jgi:hypothetical protein